MVLLVEEDTRSSETVRLHFQVKDTGIGIPKDKLDVIFAPFSQADGSWTRNMAALASALPFVCALSV